MRSPVPLQRVVWLARMEGWIAGYPCHILTISKIPEQLGERLIASRTRMRCGGIRLHTRREATPPISHYFHLGVI